MHFPADLFLDELDEFPAEYLTDLPEPFRFRVHVPDFEGVISLVTWEVPEPRVAADNEVLFDGPELSALVAGLRADRILVEDLLALCLHKREDGSARLREEHALAGAQPSMFQPGISRDRPGLPSLLARVGAEVVGAQARGELAPLTPLGGQGAAAEAPRRVAA